jgi:hypothetical protein
MKLGSSSHKKGIWLPAHVRILVGWQQTVFTVDYLERGPCSMENKQGCPVVVTKAVVAAVEVARTC